MDKRLLCAFVLSGFLLTIFFALAITPWDKIEQTKKVQNVDTGKFYDSIVEAVYDPETLDGHTIKAGEGVYFEHVIVNKSITLAGENRETTVIDGNGTGTILKITVPNVTILNFTIRNAVATGDYGLHLDNSNSSMLENIIIRNCHMGIILFWSYKNQISSLDVKNANVGVLMDHSSENHISQSNVSQCITGIKIETQSVNNTMETVNINECTYGLGLGVFANYNALKRSNITLCSHAALTFDRSGYCTFIGNTFFANNHIIEIIGPLSDNNTFAFNNFLSNTAIFSSIEPKNIWNLDYPIGGNFWSSYTGKDEQSGIYQNETGSDGIGDIPHIIGLNNGDKYPLAGAFWNFSATEQNQVLIISNSTISNFQYNNTAINFSVSGEDEATGFCRICFPAVLMNGTFQVLLDGSEIPHVVLPFSNTTHSYLYFVYNHSTHEITIVPEAQLFSTLLIFAAGTLLLASLTRRKRVPKVGT